jgi:hypothetical protein
MGASLLPDIRWQLLDGDGVPYPGALLYTYAAGTDTEQATYSDSDLTTPNTNPIEADADGRFGPIYFLPTGYKVVAKDADDVTVYTQDNVSFPGDIFAENFGDAMTADAALSETSGYTVTASNLFVTVASSGATTLNLPAVATRTQPVCIKNVGGGTVVVTPNGSDTIEGSLATYTIEAAATPLFPAIWLYPGVGTWWVFASHRAA